MFLSWLDITLFCYIISFFFFCLHKNLFILCNFSPARATVFGPISSIIPSPIFSIETILEAACFLNSFVTTASTGKKISHFFSSANFKLLALHKHDRGKTRFPWIPPRRPVRINYDFIVLHPYSISVILNRSSSRPRNREKSKVPSKFTGSPSARGVLKESGVEKKAIAAA